MRKQGKAKTHRTRNTFILNMYFVIVHNFSVICTVWTTPNACFGSQVPVHSPGALWSSATVSRDWKIHRNPHDRRGNEKSAVLPFTFQIAIFLFLSRPLNVKQALCINSQTVGPNSGDSWRDGTFLGVKTRHEASMTSFWRLVSPHVLFCVLLILGCCPSSSPSVDNSKLLFAVAGQNRDSAPLYLKWGAARINEMGNENRSEEEPQRPDWPEGQWMYQWRDAEREKSRGDWWM